MLINRDVDLPATTAVLTARRICLFSQRPSIYPPPCCNLQERVDTPPLPECPYPQPPHHHQHHRPLPLHRARYPYTASNPFLDLLLATYPPPAAPVPKYRHHPRRPPKKGPLGPLSRRRASEGVPTHPPSLSIHRNHLHASPSNAISTTTCYFPSQLFNSEKITSRRLRRGSEAKFPCSTSSQAQGTERDPARYVIDPVSWRPSLARDKVKVLVFTGTRRFARQLQALPSLAHRLRHNAMRMDTYLGQRDHS